jgi:hypothetical protein
MAPLEAKLISSGRKINIPMNLQYTQVDPSEKNASRLFPGEAAAAVF